MQLAEIYVSKNQVKIKSLCPPTSGMVGATVTFTFDPEWDMYSKTAVFRTGYDSRDVVNVAGEAPVIIPWEILTRAGTELSVGIYGCNSDHKQTVPTAWGSLGMIQIGTCRSELPSEPPAPTWTQQIETHVQNAVSSCEAAEALQQEARKTISIVKSYADEAAANAQSAEANAGIASQAVPTTSERAMEAKNEANKASRSADRADRSAHRSETSSIDAGMAREQAVNAAEAARGYLHSAQAAAAQAEAEANRASTAGGKDLGIQNASAGQVARIRAVDELGVPIAWEGADASEEGQFVLLEKFTTADEDAVRRDREPDGRRYNLKGLVIKFSNQGDKDSVSVNLRVYHNDLRLVTAFTTVRAKNYSAIQMKGENGYWLSEILESGLSEFIYGKTCYSGSLYYLKNLWKPNPITDMVIQPLSPDLEIEIWGIRG